MTLANPDTTLGQLQRGRGAGYLAALKDLDAAGDWILECVHGEPRVEPHFEMRGDYYAKLAASVELDPAPIGRYISGPADEGDGTLLAVETLGSMARRGHGRAADLLQSYLRAGHHWGIAFRALCDVRRRAPAGGRILEERFPLDEELFDAVYYEIIRCPEPWEVGIDPGSRIGRALSNSVQRTKRTLDEEPGEFRDMATEDLLRRIDSGTRRRIVKVLMERTSEDERRLMTDAGLKGAMEVRMVCVEALAHQHLPAAFSIAESILRDPAANRMAHISASFALVDLPEEMVLPPARAWIVGDVEPLRYAGETVLSLRAAPEDGPLLLGALPAAVAAEQWTRVRDLLQGVARHPVTEENALLAGIFETVAASRCRAEAVKAMRGVASFGTGAGYESLWDCELEARYAAVESVALEAAGAGERLGELAADRFEEEYLRTAARTRLGEPA